MGDEDAADGCESRWLDLSAEAEKCHVLEGSGALGALPESTGPHQDSRLTRFLEQREDSWLSLLTPTLILTAL